MKEEFKQRISDALDLPKDIVLDLSRIIITGKISIFLENHKGIIEYSKDLVRIKTTSGVVAIKGKGLVIKSIIVDEITVEGKLETIEFED